MVMIMMMIMINGKMMTIGGWPKNDIEDAWDKKVRNMGRSGNWRGGGIMFIMRCIYWTFTCIFTRMFVTILPLAYY